MSSCIVVSVDYRLAPLHQHPAALDDVLTALDWAHQQMTRCGQNPALLAVGGDSAGGTLAANAALSWRDDGRPLAAQVLAYPPLDPECHAASYRNSRGHFPDRESMRPAWASLLGASTRTETRDHGRYRTPLDATDLTAVAPAVLAVGDRDPVRDDVVTYASRLHEAAVPVRYRRFANVSHGGFLDLTSTTGPAGSPATPAGMRTWMASNLRQILDDVHAEQTQVQ